MPAEAGAWKELPGMEKEDWGMNVEGGGGGEFAGRVVPGLIPPPPGAVGSARFVGLDGDVPPAGGIALVGGPWPLFIMLASVPIRGRDGEEVGRGRFSGTPVGIPAGWAHGILGGPCPGPGERGTPGPG